jgi:hypothetical protein
VSDGHRSTQFGFSVLAIAAALIAIEGYVAWSRGSAIAVAVIIGSLVIAFVFSSMTVEVADGEIRWSLSPAKLFRQTLKISAVRDATAKAVPWYSGLGIRVGANSTLWTVNFGPALFLTLEDGRQVALGSSQADLLANAIRNERVR